MLNNVEQMFIQQIQQQEELKWEEPIKFNDISVPSFPVECLPDTLKNYVEAVAESSQTCIDMPAMAGLMCLSACIQGRYLIQGRKRYAEPLNLFGVLVAKPAERKSSVINALTKYIFEYEEEKNIALKPSIDENSIKRSILSSQIKELEKRASNPKGDYKIFQQQAIDKKRELAEMEELKPLRLIADDVSPEALTSLLADNKGKMSVISAEGGLFDIMAGRYSNAVNIDTFLKAHNGDSLRVDRKGRDSEYIKNPCLTILLAIQPQVLEDIMNNKIFEGRGLLGRILYCYPTSRIGKRIFKSKEIPDDYERDYKKLIYELLDIPFGENLQIIKLSAEAENLVEKEFDIMEKRLITDLEAMTSWAGKNIGVTLRIAGLLHIAEHRSNDKLVSGQTMLNAIKISRYFIEHARLSFSIAGTDGTINQAKYVLEKISKKFQKDISRRDIQRLCQSRFNGIDDMIPALDMLCEYGYLIEHTESNPQAIKNTVMYYINPCIYQS